MEEKKIMEVAEVHIDAYDSSFVHNSSMFLSGYYYKHNIPASQLHCVKCYVGTYKEGAVGLIGFMAEHTFQSPYMAPYGGLRSDGTLSYEKLEQFMAQITHLLNQQGVQTIRLTLAPDYMVRSSNANLVVMLEKARYKIQYIDLNHYFDLASYSEKLDYLNEKDKKNTYNALKRGMRHVITTDPQVQAQIYALFQRSRSQRGIPLKMSWEKLLEVSSFLKMDFWAVYAPGGLLCAGAVVYEIQADISQVIYWGFEPSLAHLDSMRYLSFHLFAYYKMQGKSYVDIGISTEQGVPNKGLISFKENIGCIACNRTTLELRVIS